MSTDMGTVVDGVVVKNVCFSHHGDWTGPHRRQPSCPPAKWFINECGDVYDYCPDLQAGDFPNDDHRIFDTREEAELAAEISGHDTDPDPAGGASVPQMSYEDALSYAVFAINTLLFPDASSDSDVARLELHADEILTTLVDIREVVQGLTL